MLNQAENQERKKLKMEVLTNQRCLVLGAGERANQVVCAVVFGGGLLRGDNRPLRRARLADRPENMLQWDAGTGGI
jgi:hypothetical protein